MSENPSASDPRIASDLTDKVAVVTGAASGIGHATALLLAGAGAAVVCGDLSPTVEQTAEEIRRCGGRAVSVPTDVSRRVEVEALVAATSEFGRLDAICNIAGIMVNALVTDIAEDEFDRVLGINLKGVLFGCQAAAPLMVEQGHGSIVNFSSQIIDSPSPTTATYGMAKAAVAQLTRTLALEVASAGVRVNTVAPGFVLTALTARHFTDADGTVDEEKRAQTIDMFTKGRPLPGHYQPEDIAQTVLFLVSDASRGTTGQILRPNGGGSMPL